MKKRKRAKGTCANGLVGGDIEQTRDDHGHARTDSQALPASSLPSSTRTLFLTRWSDHRATLLPSRGRLSLPWPCPPAPFLSPILSVCLLPSCLLLPWLSLLSAFFLFLRCHRLFLFGRQVPRQPSGHALWHLPPCFRARLQ